MNAQHLSSAMLQVHICSFLSASVDTAYNFDFLGLAASNVERYPMFRQTSQLTLTLKMATTLCAETLDNFQHLTWLILESQSCTLKSSHENLRTRSSCSGYLIVFEPVKVHSILRGLPENV
jgi:hypothetical protein